MMVLPMDSICCSPPERVPAVCPFLFPRMGKISYTKARSFLDSHFCQRRERGYAPRRKFSSTLKEAKICRPSGTWEIPRRTILCGSRLAMSFPKYRISP